jgi:hypothetical protein
VTLHFFFFLLLSCFIIITKKGMTLVLAPNDRSPVVHKPLPQESVHRRTHSNQPGQDFISFPITVEKAMQWMSPTRFRNAGIRSLFCGGRHCFTIRATLSNFPNMLRRSFQAQRRHISSTRPSTFAIKIQHAQSVFQDPTLAWAQQNPQLAQACLNPPSFHDVHHCKTSFDAEKPKSLEEYLKWRRWVLPQQLKQDDKDERDLAVALISHVLSAPLTLASRFVKMQSHADSDDNDSFQSKQHWCCVGARAEATLPSIYWREFLLLAAASSSTAATPSKNPLNFETKLQFTGPDIPPNLPQQTVNMGSSGSITLQGGFRGLYHDSPSASNDKFDGFVLFNPGCAHPNHVADWETTLATILEQMSSQPNAHMLVTAHSTKDAERDHVLLKHSFGLDLDYRENAFASRICYQDPFDPSHLVRPNHYVATWSSSV